jgi:hypothetical protein
MIRLFIGFCDPSLGLKVSTIEYAHTNKRESLSSLASIRALLTDEPLARSFVHILYYKSFFPFHHTCTYQCSDAFYLIRCYQHILLKPSWCSFLRVSLRLNLPAAVYCGCCVLSALRSGRVIQT